MQIPRSPQRWVAGEAQFFIHGKDADLVSFSLFDLGVAREDEGRLRQVGLTGQLLHLAIAEATRVGDDGQLVAFQWTIGEDIELNERKGSTSHGYNSALNYENVRSDCQRLLGMNSARWLFTMTKALFLLSGSEGGPVTLPVFKTGERRLRCRWCVRLAHASAIYF